MGYVVHGEGCWTANDDSDQAEWARMCQVGGVAIAGDEGYWLSMLNWRRENRDRD